MWLDGELSGGADQARLLRSCSRRLSCPASHCLCSSAMMLSTASSSSDELAASCKRE